MLTVLFRAIRIGGGLWPSLRLGLSVMRREGWTGVLWRLNSARRMSYIDQYNESSQAVKTDYNRGYSAWCKRHESDSARIRADEAGLPVLISIVMPVFRPKPELLERAINSVLKQSYPHWELCICDDASMQDEIIAILRRYVAADRRIKLRVRTENGHIASATNDALAMATGEFVALLDNDDELQRDALAHVRIAVGAHPSAQLLYSDEDKIDEKQNRHNPYFKPEFNPVLMLAQNMVTHLCVYRASTLKELGGLAPGVDGAQDWDLAWRLVELKGTDDVVHIPHVLYHWRETLGSTARGSNEKQYATEAQLKVVEQHLARIGRPANVTPSPLVEGMLRVRHTLITPEPLVSIIVPTRDKQELLETCISSLFDKTAYRNFEVIVVDNGSQQEKTQIYLKKILNERGVRTLRIDIPFNYSTLNNRGVADARGDFILMLNNDIEITDSDWLGEMMSWAQFPETGCVGAKLWYPNNTLQHGGVILGINGLAGHAHRGVSRFDTGYHGRASVHQNLTAVTGACMLVKKSIYEEVGGLDEQFAVAYNDIDFCLRVVRAGYRNVWTPYAEMLHHESATRGADAIGSKRVRLEKEIAIMKLRWPEILDSDPAYSPNLTRLDENFSINTG